MLIFMCGRPRYVFFLMCEGDYQLELRNLDFSYTFYCRGKKENLSSISDFIIPLLCGFTTGQENAQTMPAYFTVQSQFDRLFAEGGQSKIKIQWNNKPLIRCFGR